MSRTPSFQLTIEGPAESMDAVLREGVSPLARACHEEPAAEAFYFHRLVKPRWNLRVETLARGRDLGETLRDLADRSLRPLEERGLLTAWRCEARPESDPAAAAVSGSDDEVPPLAVPGDRELGGEAVIGDVARLFHHDSAACLALLDCEAAEGMSRSRREYSLLMTEWALDLMGFDRQRRLAFYHLGHRRPFEQGTWTEADRPTLEARYRALRDGLAALLAPEAREKDPAVWGGREPAAIAAECLFASRPHLEALRSADREGALDGSLVAVAHALCQRHVNRLGLDGLAEAVLRYLMFRLHEEGRVESP